MLLKMIVRVLVVIFVITGTGQTHSVMVLNRVFRVMVLVLAVYNAPVVTMVVFVRHWVGAIIV
jgi:hypothetical protein